MKVVSVVGNRPQYIKSASLAISLADAGVERVVVGRRFPDDRDLLQTFQELGLREPEYRLDSDTLHPELVQLEVAEILFDEDPDLVVVYGDDAKSTLPAARAAMEAGIPLAHVEAGVRCGNVLLPEERIRIEVDCVSSLLFSPDDRSRSALESEAVRGDVHVVGDVMADMIRLYRKVALKRYAVRFQPGTYLVVSVHREENLSGRRLERILSGLNRVGSLVVFPAQRDLRSHISRQRFPAGSTTSRQRSPAGSRIQLIEPLSYFEFMTLVSQARAVVTDSGGVQKEAYWFGVPCITLRAATEWEDTVATGGNVLVDDDPDAIVTAAEMAKMPGDPPALYGDGRASQRIAKHLVAWHKR